MYAVFIYNDIKDIVVLCDNVKKVVLYISLFISYTYVECPYWSIYKPYGIQYPLYFWFVSDF